MAHKQQQGFTLIEISTVLSVLAATVATAIGGFGSLIQKLHTEGVAAELAADLQFVRTEAVSRNRGVRITFDADDTGARCYVIHTGAAADCSCDGSGMAACSNGAIEIKTVAFPNDGRTRVQANVSSMFYDPLRGTVSPAATLQVIAADGRQLRHVVNILGRVRTCSAVGNWASFRPC